MAVGSDLFGDLEWRVLHWLLPWGSMSIALQVQTVFKKRGRSVVDGGMLLRKGGIGRMESGCGYISREMSVSGLKRILASASWVIRAAQLHRVVEEAAPTPRTQR